MTAKYKYHTKVETPGEVLVMRVLSESAWPKDQLDMETLVLEGTDRRAALKEAYTTEAHHWG